MLFIFCGCATQKHASNYQKKRGLMLLENTEMSVNKKYHSKHNRKTKAKALKQHRRLVRQINKSRKR